MKSIILKDFGSVENLVYLELPMPVNHENEVLIQVKAISINPVDIKTRSGKALATKLKTEDPIILGWDIAGIVKSSKSDLFSEGDKVFGMVNFPGHGKAYSEFVVAPADQLSLKPANVGFEEAAAACLAALTAWQALVENAKIKKNDRVLIHAAAGGVGNYAVQIAKNIGAYVIGTSSAENRDFVLSLGADEHIDYKSQPFENVTDNIDFVLDTIGGEYIDRSLKVIKKGGAIISIPSGVNDGVAEKAKEHGVMGSPMMVHSSGADMTEIASLMEKGVLKSHVSQIFDFDQMREAHLSMETGKTQGKIIVIV